MLSRSVCRSFLLVVLFFFASCAVIKASIAPNFDHIPLLPPYDSESRHADSLSYTSASSSSSSSSFSSSSSSSSSSLLDGDVQREELRSVETFSRLASAHSSGKARRLPQRKTTTQATLTSARFCNFIPSSARAVIQISGASLKEAEYKKCVSIGDLTASIYVSVDLYSRVYSGGTYYDTLQSSDYILGLDDSANLNVILAVPGSPWTISSPVGLGNIPEGYTRFFFWNALQRTNTGYKVNFAMEITATDGTNSFVTLVGPMLFDHGGYYDYWLTSATAKIQCTDYAISGLVADAFSSASSTVNEYQVNLQDNHLVVGLVGSMYDATSYPATIAYGPTSAGVSIYGRVSDGLPLSIVTISFSTLLAFFLALTRV